LPRHGDKPRTVSPIAHPVWVRVIRVLRIRDLLCHPNVSTLDNIRPGQLRRLSRKRIGIYTGKES
jgi:hypothetical protein